MNRQKIGDYDVLGTVSFNEVPESNIVEAQPHHNGTLSKTNNKGMQGKTGKRKKKGVQRNTSVLIPKTYKLPSDLVDQVGRVAYWQRRKVQDIVAEALSVFLRNIPNEDKETIP